MSSNHTVEIKITAANLADPALQQVIAELKGVATTAETVSVRTKAAGAGVREMGASVAAAAGQYRTVATELQAAATKADAAKRAFSEAARAVGGERLAGNMFPQLARDAEQAEGELRRLQTEARQTVGVLDQVHVSAGSAGTGFLQMAGSIGNVVTGIFAGTHMITGFAEGAVRSGMSILSLNANLEQTGVAFRQLLGSQSAADGFMKQLQDFAAHTPFEFPQLAKAAQQLLGVGLAAKNVIPYMTGIGDAVAAFGGGAEQIDQVTRAITQMQSKGKITAEEMMQMTEAQIPAWQALASATGLSVAKLQEMSSQGKLAADTYLPQLITGMEQLFGGNMAAQATTFTGMLSSVMDNLRQAATTVTKPLFDDAKMGLQSFLNYTQTADFGNKVQQWTHEVETDAAGLASWIQAHGPGIFDGLKTGAENAVTTIKTISTTLADIANSPEVTITVNVIRKVIDAIPKEDKTPPSQPDVNAGPAGNDFVPEPPKASHGPIFDAFALAAKPANAMLDLFDKTDKELTFLDKLQHNYYQTSATDIAHLTELSQSHNETYKRRAQFILDEIGQYHSVISVAQLYYHQEQAIDRLLSNQHSAGISGADAKDAQARQERIRLINTEIDANAQAAEANTKLAIAQRSEHDHMRQLNIDSTDYFSTLTAGQRSYADMTASVMEVKAAQTGLAQTYQIGLDLMGKAQASGSQYKSELDALTAAHDELIKKKEQGQPLDLREQMLLEKYPQLYGRLQGGIRDATIGAGLYAAANTEVMLAQDALNEAIKRGETNLTPYQDALHNAQILAGNSEFADPMTTSLNSLSSTVSTVLVPALNDLKTVIGELDGRSFTINGKVVVDDSALMAFYSGVGGGLGVGLTAAGPGDTYTGTGQHKSSGGVTSTTTAPPIEHPPPGASGLAYTGSDLAEFGHSPSTVIAGGGNPPRSTGDPPPANLPGTAADNAQNTADLTRYTSRWQDANADVTQTMGDIASTFSDDYLAHLKTYEDAAKGAVDLMSATSKLIDDLGGKTIVFGDHERANVAALQQITEYATRQTGDSAQLFGDDYLAHLKTYADAAKSGIDLLDATLTFTKNQGDTVVQFGDWQRRNVANLKFISEEATRSVGDSAQMFSGPYLDAEKTYADAAKSAVDLESTTLQFVKDMGDNVVQFGDFQRKNIANLKFIAEDSARSVGDSAQMFDGPYLAHLTEYADAAKAALEVESGALQLVKDMGDTVVEFGDWQRKNIGNLKFIAEDATKSVGDSAAIMDGPYLTNIKTYTDAAGAALSLLSSTLDLLDSMRSKSGALVLAQTDMSGNFKALAAQARSAADQVGAASDTWTDKLHPNLKDFTDDASASLSLVSNALDLVTSISQQGKSLALAQTDLSSTYRDLAHQARSAADEIGAVSDTWNNSLHPNLKDFTDAASSSLSLLGNVITLLQAIHDASKGTLDVTADEAALFAHLALISHEAADAIGATAHTWDGKINQNITDFSDAAGKSLTLLGNVIDLLKAIHDPGFDPSVFAQDLVTLFDHLTLVASEAATAVGGAGATWDSKLNQGITDFTDGAGKSLGLLDSVITTLQNIADLPKKIPDVGGLAAGLVNSALIVTQAVSDANTQWDALVAKGDAVPIESISKWAEGAGKAVSLVGDVANAYKAMADLSAITTKDVQIFEHNWEVILAMIPDLVEKSKPYLDDAKEFKSIAEMIAKEFQDAATAIQTVSGKNGSGAGGSGGGSGGGDRMTPPWAKGLTQYQSTGPSSAAAATQRLNFNEFLATTLGWSTDTQQVMNNNKIEVHHTIDTGALNQAIQYQASLLKPKYDAQGRPNQPLDRTYADEFLSLLQIMQSNSDIFGKDQQGVILAGLKQQLGALGLTDDAALGKALFGSMGLTPDVLKSMGLDQKTIDDLTSSMGESFLSGTANPVADATGAAVSDALTAGMQPFADTVGSSVHDGAYSAVNDAATVQAQIIADSVHAAIDQAFRDGIRDFAAQLAPAA